jgi:large subunit ribosomal protein L3
MEKDLEKIEDVTVIVHTVPRLTGIKKKPDVMEISLGGRSVGERFGFAREALGKEARVSEVFRSGELVDVTAVTKGKGFQGPVKRFGIKIRSRKTDDARRNPGTLGPWHPHQVMWTVPLAGQMGYHQRTEFNKRILRIGDSELPVNPSGGFLRYGEISGDYSILLGSTPGPSKRLIMLRRAARPWRNMPEEAPNLTAVSVASPQGR